MENSKNNFEEFIKAEADKFSALPSEKVWSKLSENLTTNQSQKPMTNRWLLLAAATVVGLILCSLLYLFLKGEAKVPISSDPTRVYANYQSTDIFQIQQIKNAVKLMERENKNWSWSIAKLLAAPNVQRCKY